MLTLRTALLGAALGALVWIAIIIAVVQVAKADHSMCGLRIPDRVLTVSVDPDLEGSGVTQEDVLLGFDQWNNLGQKVLGRDIFAVHYGEWFEADILLTNHGYPKTWVDTPCRGGYEWRGNNLAIVHLGWQDSAINRQWLVHELGHTLGLADHVPASTDRAHYVNAGVCPETYHGVMSACASMQNWLDSRLSDDATMLRNIWH